MARPALPRSWAHSSRQRSDIWRFEQHRFLAVRCRQMPLLIFLTRSGSRAQESFAIADVFFSSFKVCPFGGLHRI